MRTLAALFLFSTVAWGQECSADGIVVNSVTGEPVARADLTVNQSAPVTSDIQGKWRIDGIACGVVTFHASRQTFLSVATPEVRLVAGQTLHDVQIRLAPQSAVTGRVVDDFGDPVAAAWLSVMTLQVTDGIREFKPSRLLAQTNDIGEFRIAALAAGKYVFCVSGPPGRHAYAAQCAAPLKLTTGFSATVDLRLATIKPRQIRGVVAGVPAGGLTQIVLQCGGRAYSGGAGPDGKFEIGNVPSGSCGLTATAFVDDGRLAATQQVTIGDSDLDDVRLSLERPIVVTGRVRISSSGSKEIDLSRSFVHLISTSPKPGDGGQTIWDDDRTSFTLTQVVPGNYRLEFKPPSPFIVESATVNGRDVIRGDFFPASGASIEVVISDKGGTLEGEVSTDGPAVRSLLLIERQGLGPVLEGTDASGHFKVQGLEPGDYKVSAWDDSTNLEYGNPAWMQLHARRVDVTVGARQTTRVKVIRQVAPDE